MGGPPRQIYADMLPAPVPADLGEPACHDSQVTLHPHACMRAGFCMAHGAMHAAATYAQATSTSGSHTDCHACMMAWRHGCKHMCRCIAVHISPRQTNRTPMGLLCCVSMPGCIKEWEEVTVQHMENGVSYIGPGSGAALHALCTRCMQVQAVRTS